MTTPPPGSMRLHDSVVPDVPGGVYRVRTSLDLAEDGTALDAPVAHDAFLEVTGPRFTLGPTDIAGVHPPPGSVGAFSQRLPHVTLTRRTLPWERRFADGTPWLALLLTRPEEAELLAPQPLREAVGEDHFAVLSAFGAIDGDGPMVSVLVPSDPITQQDLLPHRRDVSLLTHVRQVNLADTELAGADDDGWFAVVVANRLPTLAGPYRASLVSLEGREVLLSASANEPTPFVVLHQWEFEVGEGGVFEVLARGFYVDALHRTPSPVGAGDPPQLFTRVDHDGQATSVPYSGPLRAGPDAPVGPADTGVEAAATLGRLLGAADGRFLSEVVGWHREVDRAETAQVHRHVTGGGGARERLDALVAAAGARLSRGVRTP